MDCAYISFFDGKPSMNRADTEELEQIALFLVDDAASDPRAYSAWLRSSDLKRGGNTAMLTKIGNNVEIQMDPMVYGAYDEPALLTQEQLAVLLQQLKNLIISPPLHVVLFKDCDQYYLEPSLEF